MSTTAKQEYFKGIGKIKYEGKETDNPLAYKYYNPDQMVAGKKMKDHLSLQWPIGTPCAAPGETLLVLAQRKFPWMEAKDPLQAAKDKADAAFEFLTKMGFEYYCFHDYDLIEEGETLLESEKRIAQIVDYLKEKQKATGIKVLWGTANCFSNPRYMNGAATNPNFDVVARAGAQVKIALDATIALGGENYVFWGGREGYMSLLNTDMKRNWTIWDSFIDGQRLR